MNGLLSRIHIALGRLRLFQPLAFLTAACDNLDDILLLSLSINGRSMQGAEA